MYTGNVYNEESIYRGNSTSYAANIMQISAIYSYVRLDTETV